ncbi:PREDICTED: myoneurin-like, partial [Dinoponera quadriceps]|uniref:Myoneurin-like n=1 Tax=Dinoponera quadriceps TaxID=609295 RepID=A0A6P3XX81_DINQU
NRGSRRHSHGESFIYSGSSERLVWDGGTGLKLLLFLFPDAIKRKRRANRASIEELVDLPVQVQVQVSEKKKLLPPFAELKIPKASDYVGARLHGQFVCEQCGRSYMRKDSLQRHTQWECGKEPQFKCPQCPQRCKRKAHWLRHIRRQHPDLDPYMFDVSRRHIPKIEVD